MQEVPPALVEAAVAGAVVAPALLQRAVPVAYTVEEERAAVVTERTWDQGALVPPESLS